MCVQAVGGIRRVLLLGAHMLLASHLHKQLHLQLFSHPSPLPRLFFRRSDIGSDAISAGGGGRALALDVRAQIQIGITAQPDPNLDPNRIRLAAAADPASAG